MYKILGSDQKEYGPASAEQVRQWLAEGRITARTQLQPEGGNEWKALSEFPEFAAMVNAAAVTSSREVRSPSAPPPIPPRPSVSSGLAITSLVLGILSITACAFFTGIPAIITGHIAHRRSRRAPQRYGGQGFAIAGFVMGYVSLALIPILAALLLPALAKAKEKAQRIQCVNNLKQIGLAAQIWATDHGNKFPPDFISMSKELTTPGILVCPADGSTSPAMAWGNFGPENVSYEYLEPGIEEQEAPQKIVFQCPIHGNMAWGDGSVQQGGRGPRRNRK